MANNAAMEFLKKLLSDEALKARFAGKTPAEAAAAAAELGFAMTEEDLLAAEHELREKSSADVDELNVEDMERVAGGRYFNGDIAKDGHEMGCLMFYHGYEWSYDNKEWCSYNYF